MKVLFDEAKIEQDNGVWLKLKLKPQSLYPARKYILEKKEVTYSAEIKQHRESRSLNANSYCWVLCDEIGKAIRQSNEDIYRKAILDVGVFVKLYVPETDADSLIDNWSRNGVGWIAMNMGTVRGYSTIHAYKGSSAYDTAEMSRLLDWLVEEAQNLGIDTRTPDEIASMKALWDEK